MTTASSHHEGRLDERRASGGKRCRLAPMRDGHRPLIEPIWRFTPASAAAPWRARMRDPVSLSGYIGDGTEFDKAIAEFARANADQTEQDWRALLDAIAVGRIAAEPLAAGQPP